MQSLVTEENLSYTKSLRLEISLPQLLFSCDWPEEPNLGHLNGKSIGYELFGSPALLMQVFPNYPYNEIKMV